MNNEINVWHALHGCLDERVHDKGVISRYLSDMYANASGSIVEAHEGPKMQH